MYYFIHANTSGAGWNIIDSSDQHVAWCATLELAKSIVDMLT